MPNPDLTAEQIDQVSSLVAQYIASQRDIYVQRAAPLSTQQKTAVDGFFSTQLLASTRLVVLRGERVANPEFYPMLRNMGFSDLPDQSAMAAITFSDVVVSHQPVTMGLLFHELVHVEQYRQLGVQRFAELYVRGFLSGGSYNAIPLEVCAYTLGWSFETKQTQVFSVTDEVGKWIRDKKF